MSTFRRQLGILKATVLWFKAMISIATIPLNKSLAVANSNYLEAKLPRKEST